MKCTLVPQSLVAEDLKLLSFPHAVLLCITHACFHMPCCHGRVVTERIKMGLSKNRYRSRFSLAEGKRCAAPLYGCFNPDLKLAQCVLLEDLHTFVIRATAIITNLQATCDQVD